MHSGALSRATLINSIYKRGVLLSGKARVEIPNSNLVNHISTDVSRVDQAAQFPPGVGRRVPGRHVIAARQEVGDPAAADDSGADAGDAADVLG